MKTSDPRDASCESGRRTFESEKDQMERGEETMGRVAEWAGSGGFRGEEKKKKVDAGRSKQVSQKGILWVHRKSSVDYKTGPI